MKRILFILCFIFLIFLTGCLKQPDRQILIKFSSWGSESEISILKPLLKEFEEQNPDIKVEFIHIPKNYFQKLHLLAASALTPDVVFINNINGVMYAENNIFADLTDLLKNDETLSEQDFFEQSLKAFTHKRQLYAIPRDVSNLVIYYNKDIFDRYNVSYPKANQSFEEFLQTCRKLTKDIDRDGKIDQFAVSFEENPLFWLPFLWSNSGGLISKNLDKIIINKPESIEALQFYANLRNKYHVAPTKSDAGSATMAQLFMQQKIAMHISGRWSTPRYRKDINFRWDTARFPSGESGSVVDCDTSGWAISKKTKHKKEAWKLVRFLAGKKSVSSFTKSGLIVPARKDVAYSEVFLDKTMPPNNSKVFTDIIPEAIPTPVTENYQEIKDIINVALEPLWNGQKTAKEVIDEDLVERLQEKL